MKYLTYLSCDIQSHSQFHVGDGYIHDQECHSFPRACSENEDLGYIVSLWGPETVEYLVLLVRHLGCLTHRQGAGWWFV